MKKLKYITVAFAILLVISSIVIWLLFPLFRFLVPPNKDNAIKEFKKNKQLLEDIVSYLEGTEGDVYIHKLYSVSELDEITDNHVKKTIKKLFRRGFVSVEKRSNQIIFHRWSVGRDFGAGIVCCFNDQQPIIEYVIDIEPIMVENDSTKQWYYYESK